MKIIKIILAAMSLIFNPTIVCFIVNQNQIYFSFADDASKKRCLRWKICKILQQLMHYQSKEFFSTKCSLQELPEDIHGN